MGAVSIRQKLLHTPLDVTGGDGVPGIIGPRVPRVAAPHLFFNFGVDAVPERAQVAGDG
jgi:hypothetical protein